MSDEKQAEAIRKAADALLVEIQKACDTGLMVKAEFFNTGSSTFPKPPYQFSWRHSISITRNFSY